MVVAVLCVGLLWPSTDALANPTRNSDLSGNHFVASMAVLPDGSWRLVLPPDGAGALSAQWDATVCAGRFFGPVKVNNTLEWGAEQTCEGDYAPQYIRMRLQSTCTDWYCQRFVDETTYLRTPPSEDFTRVSRRHFNPRCGSGTLRKYRIKALAYVRGVEFGPFISNESVQACDISP
jgi:hypothetical protein